MTMDCGEARRLLLATGGPQELTGALEAAQRHLAECAACQRFEADLRRLAAQIRDHAPRESAPLEVRERLFARLAAARAGGIRATRSRRRVAAGAALLLLVIWMATADWYAHRAKGTQPLVALADDHMRAVGGEGVLSSDTLVVSRWLRARLPFPVAIPLMPGLELRGARLWVTDARRGAVVEYRAPAGEAVSYYVVPVPDGRSLVPAGAVRRASRAGYHVVAWSEPGLLHALVASLPESRLVELARLCMREMRIAAAQPRSNPAWPTRAEPGA